MTTKKTILNNARSMWYRLLAGLVLLTTVQLAGAQSQCNLVCQGNVNISLSSDCSDTLNAVYFLQPGLTLVCLGPLQVSAVDQTTGVAVKELPPDNSNPLWRIVVTSANLGHTLKVTVKQLNTGNSCWGFAKVEDKLPPVVDCRDVTLSCSAAVPTPAQGLPNVKDCSNVTWTSVDTRYDLDCSSAYSYRIDRLYTFTDAYGNVSTCLKRFYFVREAFLYNVVSNYQGFPVDTVINCKINFPTVPTTDGYRHPHPSYSGGPKIKGVHIYPDGAGFCEYNANFTDQVLPICAPGTYKIVRTWTVADWCLNNVYTYIQLIKIADMDPPVITCPPNATVSTELQECTGTFSLPAPTVTTSCNSPVEVTMFADKGRFLFGNIYNFNNQRANILTDLPIGITKITYIAENKCSGLRDTCSYLLKVIDDIAPIPVCDELTRVALGSDGTATVDAFTFDDGSHDNCGIAEFKVRRLESCKGLLSQDSIVNPFRPSVKFECCDVGDTIMVEMRVKDLSGNFNSCMVQVIVEDKLPPRVVCPPNVTIGCGTYDFTTNAATEAYLNKYFGKVVTSLAEVDSIFVNIAYDNTQRAVFVGFDGLATDNCASTVTQKIDVNLNNCGVGTIVRTFTATDKGNRKGTCTQVITVVNERPFYINPNAITTTGNLTVKNDGVDTDPNDDIRWPDEEVQIASCSGNGVVDTTLTGAPRIFEDRCDLVAVTYEDLILPIQPPACFKILRKWTVIDWCQYHANDPYGRGYWTYTQVIKVVNTIAPVIKSTCRDTTLCLYSSDCNPTATSLTLDATDDCTPTSALKYTWRLDIGNDGSFDLTGTGNTATLNNNNRNNVPYGTHMITWGVEDGCGNVKTCTYTVTLKDCKKPTPICLNGLAVDLMPNSGMVVMAAIKFNNASYDNCSKTLRYKLAKVGQYPTNRPDTLPNEQTFTCRELGTQVVALYVGDDNNNWDYCETYVIIQNNMGANCTGSGSASISGAVKTEMGDDIEQVTIKAIGSNTNPVITGSTGRFAFPNLAKGQNYIVSPEKDMNPRNGVSTYDLVLMSKHILGLDLLRSPYKLIAADVNKSGTISTFDMVELRKLILNIYDKLPNNSSWRFVDATYQFQNPDNPFSAPIPESKVLNNVNDLTLANFIGVKVGDINGSASPNSLLGVEGRSAIGTLELQADEKDVKAGEEVKVSFRSKQMQNLQGYQFTLNFDHNALEFVRAEAGNLKDLTEANFGLTMLQEGVITTSWNGTSEVSEGTLFTLTFKATANTTLSKALFLNSRYTEAEAYTNEGDNLDVQLTFGGKKADGQFELYQNQPNPFKGSTTIGFYLPEAGTAKLSIFDLAGKTIKTVQGDYAKGYNEIRLQLGDLQASGVLYYRLDTPTGTATRKMVIQE